MPLKGPSAPRQDGAHWRRARDRPRIHCGQAAALGIGSELMDAALSAGRDAELGAGAGSRGGDSCCALHPIATGPTTLRGGAPSGGQ